ncbi:MAG: 16S rRNA (guanine(966)-N(2))-methyltransferase RsmD [Planctomycetes bacterium RBG_16_59_8]|nr:MAG: 16S rRNA (guanine(966)-N(2))-methyltransferase RsmD [Planctomycetes bacterium RBG_16_59_8]
MRLTGGTARGRILKSAPGEGMRPALAILRKSLFDILGPRVADRRVLDLFAGAGSLGFEALSRGASFCRFVESNRHCAAAIEANIATLGFTGSSEVLVADVFRPDRYLGEGSPFHIVFVAPPYRYFTDPSFARSLAGTLERLASAPALENDALIIVEHREGEGLSSPIPRLEQIDERRYGQTVLLFFRKID